MKTPFFAVLAALACATLHGAGTPFELTGQIMMIADTSPRRLHVMTPDIPCGHSIWDLTEPKVMCSSGDIIKVKGFQDKPTGAVLREVPYPVADYATNITVLSSAELPETVHATVQDIERLEKLGRFVHADGIVVSVVRDATNATWNWLILQTDTGAVRAAATEHDYPYVELRKLLDAEVRIKGIIHEFNAWRRFLGRHIILYGKNGITVTKAAGDPFAESGHGAWTSHRKLVSGTVVGLSSRRIYIRDAANALISVSPSDLNDMPAAGESVTVAGFAKNGPLGIQLTEAAVRRDDKPRSALEHAENVDVERLLAACRDNDIVDASLYGKPVRIQGRVANSTEDIVLSGRIMLECNRKNVLVDIAHLPNVHDALETGSLLEVCGICIPQFDADVTNMVFPEFKGLVVVPRATDDVRVLRTPPWWTPARLAAVIVALVLMLVAILVWNRMLTVLSERRGRALCDEQMASAISELKVEERTRLAVELHDSISQVLTGIALQIDAAIGSGMDESSKAGRFLATARSMLASCRHELRCCIWDLRARTFEENDLPEAIQRTLAPHIGDIPLRIRFNIPRSMLSESLAHDMLRIIRELAVNSVRHGKATQIKVFGECRGNIVRFCVKDNGCGFDQSASPGPAQGHFGLSGIRERVGRRNGELSVESRVGEGTSVTASLMIGEEEGDGQ
ncbi:MAG: hypothetical protein K6G91_05485 [Kiritimatiellae bacterium]|nr:hypothetical protein [Kiritimatiellia bacterium]